MPEARKLPIGRLVMITCVMLTGCGARPAPTATLVDTPTPIRLLALGDSYTIGESVGVPERWPVQLAAALRERGIPAAEPVIVAQTGWTTGELLDGIEQQDPSGPFDLVSLLIGVNNQYRGGSLDEYRSEFRLLLQRAIAFAGGDPGRMIVLSIPDWGVTPFASSRDRERIASEIDQFNEVNREEAESAGAHYIDITPISRQAATDPELVAADGLHPSGMMYSAWVPLVLSKSLTALGEASP
jgi:lysophospholipase L1-like esterase